MRIILVVTVCSLAFSGCLPSRKEEALRMQVDSLRYELDASNKLTGILMEVGEIIDSIDVSRNSLRMDMADGISYNDYVARLRDIQVYVMRSTQRLAELEDNMQKAKTNQKSHLTTIKQLKNDLELRATQIADLTAQVEKYKDENANLVNTVALQGAELSDKMELLAARQEEVARLEADIKALVEKSQFDLADAYYAQAQALEEAAKRTKLAPRKKKTTQQEALELYKLALATGKTEAKERIEGLEKSI